MNKHSKGANAAPPGGDGKLLLPTRTRMHQTIELVYWHKLAVLGAIHNRWCMHHLCL